jgi:hypothetical protein
VLASFSLTVLFIADAMTQAAGEVMTLSPRDIGTCSLCMIKGDDTTFLTHDVFVVCASMMPELRRRGHMAIVTPSISGNLVVFWVARASPTTVDL